MSGEKDCPNRVAAERNNNVEAESWVLSVESWRCDMSRILYNGSVVYIRSQRWLERALCP